ncbi:cyclase family protein [Kordiimonas lacus]|uniref:Kynurenine formamidase n=1 Tax=Kordiimonas lacus TaxID=637679 RepID=A0A1G6TQ16_9PROT|nr:cyclase family protein [Kordiimonas lacus]SDD31150.1 Kynurenine formamidase [Kordiimonas lacus]
MLRKFGLFLVVTSVALSPVFADTLKDEHSDRLPMPRQVVDLGALITEKTPETFWGAETLKRYGFEKSNRIETIHRNAPTYVANSYYTLFNHGGPHIDAPNHTERDAGGVDTYPLSRFYGPAKVFNFSTKPQGSKLTVGDFKSQNIQSGDVVLIYTAYQPPQGNDKLTVTSLSEAAAEFLASKNIAAFGTDALSVEHLDELERRVTSGETGYKALLPVHYSLLTAGIATYEQLVNIDQLIGKKQVLFIGLPLNIKDGNGVPVRPVAFIY